MDIPKCQQHQDNPPKVYLNTPYGLQYRPEYNDWIPFRHGDIDLSHVNWGNYDLVVIDEAARVEDDLYFAVRPMLATGGGRLIAASTPASCAA